MSLLDWDLRFFSQHLKITLLLILYKSLSSIKLYKSQKYWLYGIMPAPLFLSLVSLLSQSLASEASASIKTSPLPVNHVLMVFDLPAHPRQMGGTTALGTAPTQFLGFLPFVFQTLCSPVTEISDFTAVSVPLSILHWLSTFPLLFSHLLHSSSFITSVPLYISTLLLFYHSHPCCCCTVALERKRQRSPLPHSSPRDLPHSANKNKSGRRERWAAEL